METNFGIRADILADLWISYRDDEEFLDFIEYNDLGLPLAFAISNAFATASPAGEAMVNETFDLLLGSLGIKEDTGFETLDDLLETNPTFGTE
jgi:hypothetical protein